MTHIRTIMITAVVRFVMSSSADRSQTGTQYSDMMRPSSAAGALASADASKHHTQSPDTDHALVPRGNPAP